MLKLALMKMINKRKLLLLFRYRVFYIIRQMIPSMIYNFAYHKNLIAQIGSVVCFSHFTDFTDVAADAVVATIVL